MTDRARPLIQAADDRPVSVFQFLRRKVAHALWNAALAVHPDSDPQTAMSWERIDPTWMKGAQ